MVPAEGAPAETAVPQEDAAAPAEDATAAPGEVPPDEAAAAAPEGEAAAAPGEASPDDVAVVTQKDEVVADPFAFPAEATASEFLTDELVASHDDRAAALRVMAERDAGWKDEAPIYSLEADEEGCDLAIFFRSVERQIEFKFTCTLNASLRNVMAMPREMDLAPEWNSWVASGAKLDDGDVKERPTVHMRREAAINFPFPLPKPQLTVRMALHEDFDDSGALVAAVFNEPSQLGPVAMDWAAVNGFATCRPLSHAKSHYTICQRVNIPGYFPMWLVRFFTKFVVRVFAPKIFELVKATAPGLHEEGSIFHDRLRGAYYDDFLGPARLDAAIAKNAAFVAPTFAGDDARSLEDVDGDAPSLEDGTSEADAATAVEEPAGEEPAAAV